MTATSTLLAPTMSYEEVLSLLDGVKSIGRNVMAHCPAHEDTDPSLTIARGTNQKVLLTCHAGCSFEEIIRALGLPAGQLAVHPTETVYQYFSAQGNVLFEVVRGYPKGFRQRRPDGVGGYVYNLEGIDRVLYRLPEVIAAVRAGAVIFVVEGEKDVERLRNKGLTATCNPGGAGKWRPEYAQYLANANVIVIPDNDAPGRKHGSEVMQSLQSVAARAALLELPDLAEKGDVSDWLSVDGSIGRLQALADSALSRSSMSRLLTFAELGDLPTVSYLIDGYIQARGLNMIFGPSGVGKSFIALDMAFSIASDRAWQGTSVRRGKVVYVAAEGGNGIFPRGQAWEAEHGSVARDEVRFTQRPFSLLRDFEVQSFINSVAGFGPDLLVLDPLARLIEGADENSSKDMGSVVANLERIRSELGTGVLVTHHTGKDQTRGERGHSLLKAALDVSTQVRGSTSSGVSLEVTKVRDRASGHGLFMRLEPLGPSAVMRSTVRSAQLSPNAQKAVQVLSRAPDGLTAGVWESQADLPNSSFHAARKQLVEGGHVVGGDRRGSLYNLTEKGRSAVVT